LIGLYSMVWPQFFKWFIWFFMVNFLLFSWNDGWSKQSQNSRLGFSQSIISSIGAIYQSNLESVVLLFMEAAIFVLATTYHNFRCSWTFRSSQTKEDWNDFWKNGRKKSPLWRSHEILQAFFPRGFISKEEISDNFCGLAIAHRRWYQVISRFDNQFKGHWDSFGLEKTKKTLVTCIVIYLDDCLIKIDAMG